MGAGQSWLDNVAGLSTDIPVLKSGLSIGNTENPLGAVYTQNVAVDKTITPPLTTGAQTINKSAGTVNFAAAASSLVVTNNLVTADSIIFVTILTNDVDVYPRSVVPDDGFFTIYIDAPAVETAVGFLVVN